MHKSVTIIGGGLGGLFTGAILAQEGIKVTILEKNHTPGGGLQSYRRWGEVFDTGMHVVGGLHPGENVWRICEYLGIAGRLRVKNFDENRPDTVFIEEDNQLYEVVSSKEGFVDSLCRYFPSMRLSLEAYTDAIYSIVDGMSLYNLRSADTLNFPDNMAIWPTDKFIGHFVSAPRLKQILQYLSTLYGGVDGVTPAYVHAAVMTLYLSGHGILIGGAQNMATTLVNHIKEHGGEVFCDAEVHKIITKGKKISHILTRDGRAWNSEICISSIHPANLLPMLDQPRLLSKAYRTRVTMLPNTISAFMLNIKFKKESFPLLEYIGFYMNSYDESAGWPWRFIYLTPPQDNQDQWAHTMNITVPMPWYMVSKWSETTRPGNRGAEYLCWKQYMADKILSKMEKIFPDIKNAIDKMDVASPLTIRDYYGVKQGAMFGIQKNCNNLLQTYLSVGTRIPNLFLTGQNVNLHGICGVPLTAIMTCEAILGKDTILNKINQCKG